MTDPALDVNEHMRIEVDGKKIAVEAREVWILNKPLDVVSTAREPGSRKAVVQLVRSRRRLYPVGRLDADSTGLIVLTNDGDLANRLTHPRYGVPRTYRVSMRRAISDSQVQRLRKGVKLDDGPTAPARVRQVGERMIELTIREGRNRQVRRMAEAVGNEVASLQRIGFGGLRLGKLAEGESAKLKPSQVEELWQDAKASEQGKGRER